MALPFANITLQNGDDVSASRRGLIGENEIRQAVARMQAAKSVVLPTIHESIRTGLGLQIIGHRLMKSADGSWKKMPVAGSIMVQYLNRNCLTNAVVVEEDAELRLGLIPMGELDLYVHPEKNELLPVHAEGPIMSLK